LEARYILAILSVLCLMAYALWAGSIGLNQWTFDRATSPIRYWLVVAGAGSLVIALAIMGFKHI